jgi:transmembrane sensor
MNTNEPIDELLIKQLLSESTPEENRQVAAWVATSTDNEQYYKDFKTIWETSKGLQSNEDIDENEAWKRFQGMVNDNNTSKVVPFEPNKKRLTLTRAAAILAVLIGSLFYLNLLFGNKTITLVSTNEVQIDTLPDGSVITLNKQSSLTYAKDFNTKNREVTLHGEAFFKVTPNKQKPFDIKVDQVNVHVVGTSFNVKENTEETEVIVETGIVKVSVAKDSVRLLPKEKVIVRKKNASMQVDKNNDLLYNYYRTKVFECNNTPLYELVEALNKTYNVEITIADEKTRHLPYTSTFRDTSLSDILKVVTTTYNLSIQQSNGKIILK